MHRILLVEDHASFRQTLAYVFDQQPDFRVVAQSGTLDGTRGLMDRSEAADLGVIDLSLPDGEGTELIAELREANPEFAALVLTASLDRTEYARAVEAGAAGVLHKSADVDDILDAARRLGEGVPLISLAEGLSNKEIAAKLHMSVDTERTHMMNILNKLGVHSRIQALLFAARHGLVEIR